VNEATDMWARAVRVLGGPRAARLRAVEDAVLSASEGSPAPTGFDMGLAAAGLDTNTGADLLDRRLARFAEAVARHAYEIGAADLDELRDAGVSEETIFELVVATAAGAGLARLEIGLRALEEA
jgi:alkylhydroperoxidase family enzyme